MMRVSNTTAHGSPSPLRRSTRRFATAEKGRSAVARFLVVLIALLPFSVMAMTNANAFVPAPVEEVLLRAGLPLARFAGPIGTAVQVATNIDSIASTASDLCTGSGKFSDPNANFGHGGGLECEAYAGAAKYVGKQSIAAVMSAGAKISMLWHWGGSNPAPSPPAASTGQAGWVPANQTFPRQYCYSGSCAYNNANVTVSVSAPSSYGATSGSLTVTASPSAIGQSPSVDMSVSVQVFCVGPSSSNQQWESGGSAVIASPTWTGTTTFDISYCAPYGGLDRLELAKGIGQNAEAKYYPPGHPLYVPPTPADPDPLQTMRMSTTCKNSSGGSTTLTNSVSFHNSDTTYPPITAPVCPETFPHRSGFSANVVPLDGTGTPVGSGTDVVKYTEPAIDPNTYPQCINKTCLLTAIVTLPDGTTKTYLPGDPEANLQDRPTDDWTCKWGPYQVEQADCIAAIPEPLPPPPTGDNESGSGCFNGMGISPLTWPKGLIISPLKCLFVPKKDAMSRWKTQIDGIQNSGVIALFTTFGNFVGTVATAGKTATACPTEQAGTFDNGKTVVVKTSPIHWCDIIQNAGNQTQSSTYGQVIYQGARIMLFIWFGIYWYNRITASAGSQSAL